MSIESIFRVDGKTALVTGASSGLGAHFARTLARAGARVIVAARRTDRLHALVSELQSTHQAQAHALALDVTDSQSIKNCLDDAFRTYGAIDIIVNNAGTGIAKPFFEQTEADYDAVVDVNLKGAFLVAQEAARRMVAAKTKGTIINIASIVGERQSRRIAPYAISKAGVVQMTKVLALELARDGIRVNAIEPGYFITEINEDNLVGEVLEKLLKSIPTQRLGELTDLDGPLLLLASDAGRHMTGATLAVDGGHLVASL
jgi:NAD(P)-dependent dehydrogenase (short-subunit alcohol dehydrogenase family)